MRMKKFAAAFAGAALVASAPAYAVTEIQWWNAMTGALGEQVKLIADDFNASQSQYKVVPVYKGGYADTMAAGIAAARTGNAPDILQVFEVGTATMMAAKGAILPIYKLMEQTGNKLDMSAYMPAVASYYSDTHGRLISMPFNSSTPVFFYNKDAFKKAGLDPAKPPKTWEQVGEAAAKIKSSGAAPCAFTTGWEVWVQMETMSAWDNVQFATLENGFGGLGAKLTFNNPTIVKHIATLGEWAKDGRFTYAGRTTQPEAKFYAGDCAMLTSSSAARANIMKNAKFDVGMGFLPYDAFAKAAPQNTIIGGASLWTFTGHSKAREKATAAFFEFMSSPKIQARWHQNTGYVPITKAAYELTKKQGYYEKNPGTDIAVKQLLERNPTKVSKGVRLGYLPQIRDVTDEELEPGLIAVATIFIAGYAFLMAS